MTASNSPDLRFSRIITADENGVIRLHLELPLGVPNGAFEIIVRDAVDAARPTSINAWPAGYFETVVGSLKDDETFVAPKRPPRRQPRAFDR